MAEPLIDLRVLRSRAVAATNLAATLVGFAGWMGSRTIGCAAGAAAVTTVLTARMLPGTMVPVESGYTTAFVIAAAVGALALLAALAVPRRPRAQHEPAAEPALA